MAEQEQLQKNALSTVADIQNKSEFLETRSFAPVTKSHTASSEQGTQPNLQAKSDRASGFGHSFGNLALQAPTRSVIQPKLTIGQPGDKYEQEADRVAADVVQRINQPKAMAPKQGETVQRQELPSEEEIQMKSLVQRREATAGGEASTDLASAINSSRGSGQPLDTGLQRSMGQAMGADFCGVKVHTDAQADQLNKSIQAKAFTTGQDVFFRQGEYNPGSRGKQELIAHELTHVVQQNAGAVQRSQQVVQCDKVETLKTSNAQITAAEDNKVEDKDKDQAKLKAGNIKPIQHPMYTTFQARIKQLFSEFPPSDGYDIPLLTQNIWIDICKAIDTSSPEMERKEGNTTYSNVKKGYVDMESSGYQKALSEFNTVMGTLKKVTQSQFFKAKTFGFWSKPEGRALAEKMCDLTLETSGIGAIFDKFPSLNAHKNGWDAQLWGSLSRAFGEAAAIEMTKKGKSVHVFAGGGTNKTNVFGAVESKALEKGASALGKTLEEAVRFHSVAAKSKTQREPDLTVHEGDLPGTWYSGNSWDTSLKIGEEKYSLLPEKLE